MKRRLIALLIVTILVSGCSAGSQSLLKQLNNNPDKEAVSSLTNFFKNYADDPADQITLTFADGSSKTTNDSILINRLYKDLMAVTVKKTSQNTSLTGDKVLVTLTKDDNSSTSLQFVGKYVVIGEVSYELSGASPFLTLVAQIQSDTTSKHELKNTTYTVLITTLSHSGDSMVADVKFTNTSSENITSVAATIVFLDESGKIQATKKFSQDLSNPLAPNETYWTKISCDYKEEIVDVTFQ